MLTQKELAGLERERIKEIDEAALAVYRLKEVAKMAAENVRKAEATLSTRMHEKLADKFKGSSVMAYKFVDGDVVYMCTCGTQEKLGVKVLNERAAAPEKRNVNV